MYLAQDVAGWSLYEADRLRKLTQEKGKNPKKIKQWRHVRGWTAEQAAAHLGISQSLVSMLETGKREFTRDTMQRYIAAGAVVPDDFFQGAAHDS
jgi:transcriptional regulator with XRE-family HTH domain